MAFNPVEIPAHCPYSDWPTVLNITCEQGLCAYIRQPANVYSNLAFLLAIGYLFYFHRHRNFIKTFCWMCLMVFFASVTAHGSHIKYFGVLDFTLQYMLATYLIWINCRRLSWITNLSAPLMYIPVWLVTVFVAYYYPSLSITMYAGFIVTMLFTEYLAKKKESHLNLNYRLYFASLVLFMVGVGCFMLDSKRIICDPDNHYFNLHALWHVISAGALTCLALFYKQIDHIKE